MNREEVLMNIQEKEFRIFFQNSLHKTRIDLTKIFPNFYKQTIKKIKHQIKKWMGLIFHQFNLH